LNGGLHRDHFLPENGSEKIRIKFRVSNGPWLRLAGRFPPGDGNGSERPGVPARAERGRRKQFDGCVHALSASSVEVDTEHGHIPVSLFFSLG